MVQYIGFVGTNGAGKSAACDYLESIGFVKVSLSDVVREAVHERGLTATRDHLVETANDLKEKFSQSYLAEEVYDRVSHSLDQRVVFDSIRNVSEVDFLRSKGVYIIGVDAPIEIRFERIQSRQRASDRIVFDTFEAHDDRENTGQSTGQHFHLALEHCDVVLQNTGALADLQADLDAVIQKATQR